MAKSIEDNDNEDLRAEYLAEDPKNLSEAQLEKIAEIFDMPLVAVQRIAKGMSATRAEIIKDKIY